MRLSYSIIYVVSALIMTSLMACGSAEKRTSDSRLVLAVSIEPQRYLLERIAGDRAEVVSVIDRGVNPESFDPSMAVMRSLEGSDAYFTINAGAFEEVLLERLEAGGHGLHTVDCTVGIDLIGVDSIPGHRHVGVHSEYDPHTWSSVRNSRIIARNMYNAICDIDTAGRGYYTERYQELDAELDSLDRAISDRLKSKAGRAFMVWHPSLSYFARDYGMRQIALGEENKELSAASLRDRIKAVNSGEASVLFLQKGYDAGRSQSLAAQTGAKAVEIDMLSYRWPDEIIKLADALAYE
ncbi:MAG: zinc ABC transporter substrate-binding protein [Muribaculaceae bacterium]|nr:zinc ABC transporter substrate-binding protein [Muribaculaceae bacterium]